MRALGLTIATGGFTGYAPVAPGTVGSLVGLLILFAVRVSGNPLFELGVLVVVIAAGIWSAGVVERDVGIEDPGIVVVDEVAGMLLTLLWIPLTWPTALVGFLAFRVFDIIKPFPARRAERLPGGWGIMADDLFAAVYAYMVVRLMSWLLPSTVAL
jgi:phosphatidylglycerophosphatase A